MKNSNDKPRILVTGAAGKTGTPVLLVYGDKDWAPERERQRTQSLVPGATYAVVNHGGHFLSLDQPQELSRLISNFATTEASV